MATHETVEGLQDEVEALRARLAETERALQHERVKLELINRTGEIGVWEADLAGGGGYWSPMMYAFYNRDPELGPPGLGAMKDFVHPDDFERLEQSLGQMMQAPMGAVPPIRFRSHPSLGPVRHLQTRATMIAEQGWASGAVVDVTARVEAQAEAQATNHRMTHVLSRMPFVLFSIDRDGRITYSNQTQIDENYVGTDYRLLIAEGSRVELAAAIERAWETGEVQVVRAEDVTGNWWESRYVTLPGPAGEPVELLGMTMEITEQRELELQVQQAQKLDSLGVLAGGIAHDFNNLLVGIIGNADLARLDLGENSPADASLEEILTASYRAAELCRQMLAYSGKGRFVVKVIDPREVIREMVPLLSASIAKTTMLRFDFDKNTQPVEADVSQFRQVVMNLITNASDALEGDDGVIRLATGSLDCDEEYLARAYLRTDLAPGPYTFIEVSDTGLGMDEEVQARMFEPYSSKAVGRGLGLAAVMGIVHGHRGSIRVYSELGKGTTIKVLLPASAEKAVPLHIPAADDTAWKAQGVVLVVDDEQAVLNLAGRSLERMGFTVVTALNGAEAVEIYRARGDEIVGVLLDMTMPVMGGVEAFRQLRMLNPDVRVVLTSGYNEQEATRHFAGKGLAGFLQKPYRVSALTRTFEDLLKAE